jgi:hypothetical protein
MVECMFYFFFNSKAVETEYSNKQNEESSNQIRMQILSPSRSDGFHDGQAGGWSTLRVAKGAHGESWKTTVGSRGTNQKIGIVTA